MVFANATNRDRKSGMGSAEMASIGFSRASI
jgi:hypothetical protein